MKHVYPIPKKLLNDYATYNELSNLYNNLKNITNSTIILNFSNTNFIEPNLISSLGLILTLLKFNRNIILFRLKSGSNLQKLLVKYKFLHSTSFHPKDLPENYITYNTFSQYDLINFKKYINTEILAINNFDIVNKLKTIFLELFVNISMHSNISSISKDIFISGYYNPNKDYIFLSIANRGNSFQENIESIKNIKFPNYGDYISWALERGNSTRVDTKGGLGLFMLKSLIIESYGKLYIASGYEYVEYLVTNSSSIKKNAFKLDGIIPGCTIAVKIPLKNLKENPSTKKVISPKLSLSNILKGDF